MSAGEGRAAFNRLRVHFRYSCLAGLARPCRSYRLLPAARSAGLANLAANEIVVRTHGPFKRARAQQTPDRAAEDHREPAPLARARYDRATAIPHARPPAVPGIAPQIAE